MLKKIPQVLPYSLETSVIKEDFFKENLIADKIFIFGVKRLSDYSEDTINLESGMYACIYLYSFDKEKEETERLHEFCVDNVILLLVIISKRS